jgi:hypothetical protein
LEDFVARIDTPELHHFTIHLFLGLVFDVPQLQNFIDRAEKLGPITQATMILPHPSIYASNGSNPNLDLMITCAASDRHVYAMARVYSQLSPILLRVKQLSIISFLAQLEWTDDTDPAPWLELLNPFISVESLYVSDKLAPFVATALGVVGQRVTEVLPALQKLTFQGLQPSEPVEGSIKPFVAARQVSNHPIDVHWAPRQDPS